MLRSRHVELAAMCAALLSTESCSRLDAPLAQCNVPSSEWSRNPDFIRRNDMIKIELSVREGELEYGDKDRIEGKTWADSLRDASNQSPKPAVLLRVDGKSPCADVERITRAISKRFSCDSLHCFLVSG